MPPRTRKPKTTDAPPAEGTPVDDARVTTITPDPAVIGTVGPTNAQPAKIGNKEYKAGDLSPSPLYLDADGKVVKTAPEGGGVLIAAAEGVRLSGAALDLLRSAKQ